jgi:lactam utilization protein B
MIESPEDIALHAVDLVQNGIDFAGQHVRLDTLCLHGDHPRAAQNAKLVREALERNEIRVVVL